MLVTLLLLLLILFLLLGMPLVFAMGAVSSIYLYFANISFSMLTQRMTTAVDSFLILAIPFFYLAGELMNACKLTDRIVDLSKAFVGHIHGGLAQVNIFASMIFAGMSGSATADVAALGTVLIPAMKKDGYDADFSAAVTVASAMVGPIIPPSIAMVIYGALADVSIGRMLLAGIFPGLFIIAIEMLFTYFLARKRGYPRYPRATIQEMARATYRGSAAVMFPAIIVGGILSGVFTPTEAAAAAVLYGLILGLVVYRNVGLRELWTTLLKVTFGSVRILIIIAAASAFSWIMVREQVPQTIAAFLATFTTNPTIVMLIMVVLLIIVGLFMVASSAEIVLTPILVPVVTSFGIDPIHFGVLMVFVLIIGGGTPPVGVLMYIGMDIGGVPFSKMFRAMLPYYLCLLVAVTVIALFPQISLWVPNLILGR
ncbi:TRAP transporter large permease subunit [candidate division KSB3 bacterium]|uniref:TRAP transporter large permease subunit n=1 Tax=candidate division KSB3 bacterium TaxID=2044937 RepID=A0A9D5K037_9BACT|nr:TRAP transporter large permease subunit [candidate division KSB3 bacterium]MBD3326951.1 TRAP transporter large permease subunit [candidate division KSB3 bacterium]